MKKAKQFDFKKRLETKRKIKLKHVATALLSLGLITSPLTIEFGEKLSFDYHSVDAASLAEVNLLSNTTVTSSAVAGQENTYNLSMQGTALANLEVLGPDRVALFKVNLEDIPEQLRDQVEITADGAHVRVELLQLQCKIYLFYQV